MRKKPQIQTNAAATFSSEDDRFIDEHDVLGRAQCYFQNDIPFCLVGPPGIGKTTLVMQLAGGPENVITTMGADLITADLLGRRELEGDRTVWRSGDLVNAMRDGKTFYADEITGMGGDCLRVLHSLLDHRREVFVPSNNERVQAHPDFRFVASCNLSRSGVDPLPREFRDRLSYIYASPLSDKTTTELLMHRYGIDYEDAAYLVAFARVTRNADASEGASTRQLEAAARAIRAGIDRRHAASDCILSSIVGSGQSQRGAIINALMAEGLDCDQHWRPPADTGDGSPVILESEDQVWI